MSWFSILPAYLTAFETWIIRFFLLLGTVTIGPWLLLLTYDLVLYIFRALAYEVPLIGGRARGSQRPRAPSFAERPSGRARTFSIPGIKSTGDKDEEAVRWRSRDNKTQPDSGRAGEDQE